MVSIFIDIALNFYEFGLDSGRLRHDFNGFRFDVSFTATHSDGFALDFHGLPLIFFFFGMVVGRFCFDDNGFSGDFCFI